MENSLSLVLYPNEILSKPTKEVTVFDSSLHKILDEMKVVMESKKGLGLSANQVGLDMSMFIMKDEKGTIHELINPKIIDEEGRVGISEGCLSAPSVYLMVYRPEAVLVIYQDRDGVEKKVYAVGMDARVIQHEYDHLMGKFYFEHVNRATRKQAIKALRKHLGE